VVNSDLEASWLGPETDRPEMLVNSFLIASVAFVERRIELEVIVVSVVELMWSFLRERLLDI
jgi:hypothetical protein